MCSTLVSEHLETLSSAARVAKVSGGWRVAEDGIPDGRASPAALGREAAAVAVDPVGLSMTGSEAEPGAADEAVAFFFAFLATAGGAGEDTAGGMSEPASRPATAGGEDERDIFFSENDEKPAESPPKKKRKPHARKRGQDSSLQTEDLPVRSRRKCRQHL